MPIVYLDHAATSWPKPPEVAAAVARWYAEVGVSAGRGDSDLCRIAAREVDAARRQLGALCGVPPARVAFTSGATESSNLFLRAFLRPGDRVVTTAAEHSAIARPLLALVAERGIALEIVAVDRLGYVDAVAVAAALDRAPTRLFAVNHASNVTGAVQDVSALTNLAHARGCAVMVDASQSLGLVPVGDLGADVVIGSAHKSLLGPPGLGFLAARPPIEFAPAKQGGTGSSRALAEQPRDWPGGFEAGTPNTPAIFGLAAALRWSTAQDRAACLARELQVIDAVREDLRRRLADRVRIVSPVTGARLPVLSFTLADLDPAEAGVLLADAGIHVRTGFHCAPWIHAALGTEAAGTIRVSVGPFVSAAEALQVARVLAR
jgi:cysteine desulfurase/selenocysteine lyase